MIARRASASVAALALLATGCLSASHTIRRTELERLASEKLEHRTHDVHVKQRLVFSKDGETPTPASMLVEVVRAEQVVRVTTLELARSLAAVRSGVAFIRGDDGQTAKPAAAAATAAAAGSVPAASTGSEEQTKAEEPTPPKTDDEKKREAKKDDTNTALVVGAVVLGGVFIGIGLAVSEGQRFDGYASLPEDAPIHLFGPRGELGWVPLKSLTPAMLDGVSEGVVSSRETRLERGRSAALDRVGFAYRVELGAGGLNALDRSLNPGFLGRMNVGWFPAQRFGVLAGTAFGIGPKGSVSTGTEVRPLIAIEVFPVAAGTHHAGLYAEGGYLFGSERLPSLEKQSIGTWTYGGGLLYEHELNALTALSVRGGVTIFSAPGPAVVAPQLTLGIAVY